ncbi:MAG: hypothetical protein A3F10_05985 [Coxiella sp. RIFCSPHIGHO2_12_FULL_42_15]|nr:MAG: hypothetical protein A3F10_05985 [Coxiella sp. RIFCSPHIGHO2_12_FULL_42_15]
MKLKIATDQPISWDQDKITRVISDFWNTVSEGWASIWGPHIHHGYYDESLLTPLEAQEKLITKLVELLQLDPAQHILDVGCGMGGSSLYLAKKHAAKVMGITLSEKQISIARERARMENVKSVLFKWEDALSMKSITSNSIDIVWSLESCEQFFDKKLFLQQAFRVLKPRGQLMLATWCSSEGSYEGQYAQQYQRLCRAFDLPYIPTIDYYKELLTKCHFTVEKALDWSVYVAKSWEVGISLVSAYSFIRLLKIGGLRGLRFAKQIKLMRDAFQQHRVEYGVFIARKS